MIPRGLATGLFIAFSTAMDWYGGGTLIGTTVGCGIGALATFYFAGIGCPAGAAFGAAVGVFHMQS